MLSVQGVDKIFTGSYDHMKSRASRIFSVLLGILLKKSWCVRSGILHHSPWEKCLEGWRRWNFLFLLCVWELHMMVRVWWCSDWELGETTNAFDLKTYHQTIYLSGCRRKEETWLFRTLPFFRCSGVCVVFLLQFKHHLLPFCNNQMAAQLYVSAFMTSSCSACLRVLLLLTVLCCLVCDHLVCVVTLSVAPFCLFYLLWLIKFLWAIW